jgi:hypothetical protein
MSSGRLAAFDDGSAVDRVVVGFEPNEVLSRSNSSLAPPIGGGVNHNMAGGGVNPDSQLCWCNLRQDYRSQVNGSRLSRIYG